MSRQVLAEPEPGLAAKTWARLADGTPLVTAARRGKGLVALFHVTADTTWSNLPISGLFVDMLRRIVARAGAAPADADAAKTDAQATRAPYRILDGFGVLGAPPANAAPIGDDFTGPGDAAHPPGFYGAAEALEAVNAMTPGQTLAPADYAGLAVASGGLDVAAPLDLKPWLLLAAFVGFLADGLASLWLGRAPRFVGPAATAMLLAGALAGAALDRPASVGGRGSADPESRRRGGPGDPSRLCRDRRRRGRRGLAPRARKSRARAGSAHLGGGRGAGRARSRARRIELLSPDLLAGRRRRGRSLRRARSRASPPS